MKNTIIVAAVNIEGKVATAFVCESARELACQLTNCLLPPGGERIRYVMLAKVPFRREVMPLGQAVSLCQATADRWQEEPTANPNYLDIEFFRIDI